MFRQESAQMFRREAGLAFASQQELPDLSCPEQEAAERTQLTPQATANPTFFGQVGLLSGHLKLR